MGGVRDREAGVDPENRPEAERPKGRKRVKLMGKVRWSLADVTVARVSPPFAEPASSDLRWAHAEELDDGAPLKRLQ